MSGASSWRQDRVSTWTYVLLVALLIPFLFPLGWMFLSSLKTQVQNTAYPPVWLFTPTLGNYREVFQKNPFFTFTVNSMVVAAGSTGLALLLGLHGADGSRYWVSDPVVHPLHQSEDDRHLLGAHPHPPDRGAAPRPLGDDRILRGRAGRSHRGGADRRLFALGGLPARGPALGQARHCRDRDPLVHLFLE